MIWLRSVPARLRSWLHAVTSRSRLEIEMDTELAFHLEQYTQDLIAKGVPSEEAVRRARIELGGIAVQKEEMRASLGLRLWDDLRADLRYAFRMLMKSPGFTAIAVGSLALGIGANTAIFSVAKQVLLDRLGVPHPGGLRLFHWISPKHSVAHHVWGDWDDPGNDGNVTSTSFPYPVYQQLQEQNKVLQDLFAFKGTGRLTVTVDGEAEAVQGEMVSGNYYQALGVTPALGRAILPADDAVPGSGAVVVISNDFWVKRFSRSPSVIGKVISINSRPFTIIGVNSASFTGVKNAHASSEVFVPFSVQPLILPRPGSVLDDAGLWWIQIMARSKAGVPDRTAQAALDTAFQAELRAVAHPKKDEAIPQLILADGSRGMNETGQAMARPIYVLLALAGLVLLLACANIANLLLARSAARQREMGVRLALGARRSRILRQVLTESLLLSMLGGAAGFLLGYLGRNAIPRLMTSHWESNSFDSRFDWMIFTFTASISILTGLAFGLAPAWRAMRTQVSSDLKNSTQTATHRRKGIAGKTIVAFQVALSTLLVVGALLFVRTLANLDAVNPGFRTDHLLLFSIQQPRTQYPPPADVALHRRLEEKLSAVPGVESLTLSTEALISNNVDVDNFTPLDMPKASSGNLEPSAWDNVVGDSFFSTMGIPIVAGRGFNSGDTETSPKVAVINRKLAQQFFPGMNPIGRKFRGISAGINGEQEPFEIVGICSDTYFNNFRTDPPATYFVPYRQIHDISSGMTYEIRTHVKPESLLPLLRRAVQSVDQNLPLVDIRTQTEQIDDTIQQERIFASLTAAFGVLALILASIGIYGIMAYTVSRRTNEIGIRLALGAQARQILTMILRETSWLAVLGVATGLGGALLLTRLVRSMLFGLKPNDPTTLVASAGLLFAVALLAGWVPARRASRVEPMQALRHE
jgi:predicted permease